MKYVDIRLHSNHSVLNLRYGTTVEAEQMRVLHHAKQRAIDRAWRLERDRIRRGQETLHSWTRAQREQLLNKGTVSNMEAEYIRNVNNHLELADDPSNIRFVKS